MIKLSRSNSAHIGHDAQRAPPTVTKQIDPAVAAILEQLRSETAQPTPTPVEEPHPFTTAPPPSAFTMASEVPAAFRQQAPARAR